MYGYICFQCKYCTEIKGTMKKHINSKKHRENIVNNQISDYDIMNEKYICVDCCTSFTREQSFKRHIDGRCNAIKHTKLLDKDAELSDLRKEVKNMATEFIKTNSKLTEQIVELAKKCIDSNSENCKSTLAIVKYVMEHFTNAPKLQSPDNILNRLDSNERSDKEIIYNYKNKSLHEYIGDFIVQEYRKKDPLDQSMWSSDTLRFTYIIMGEEWVRDKNGETIIDKIISKIIDKIREINKAFMIKCSYVNSTKNDIKSKHKIKLSDDHYLWNVKASQIAEWIESSMDLDKKLDTNILCKQVLKYISPKFDIATLAQEIKNNNV